ncbi:MAG: TlpA family protein disulfide reductase, partial [Bacillales bacterium]
MENTMRGRNLISFLLLCLLVIVAIISTLTLTDQTDQQTTTKACHEQKDKGGNLQVGSCAPNFRLPDLNGKPKELYATNQKPTFINFWATWCGPCQSELPYIEAAYKKYKNQVNFMMVNATSTERSEEDIIRFLKKNQYTFPVVLDRKSTNITFGKYKLVGIPVTLAIDPHGRIVYKRIGSIRE